MKICISSGHGKYIRGASGSPVPPQLDEVDEARRVVDTVADMWRELGVEVEVFHDNTSHDQGTNLETIVAAHNNAKLGPHDYDISVHFNAFDGNAHGVEVWHYSQPELAAKVSAAIAAAGHLTNRGGKFTDGLYVINNTNEPCLLLEVVFCDNTSDSNLYNENFNDICEAIAESISGVQVPDEPERPPIEPPDRPPIEEEENRFVMTLQAYGDMEININGQHFVAGDQPGNCPVINMTLAVPEHAEDLTITINGQDFHGPFEQPPEPSAVQKDIFATTFGGAADNEQSAYDGSYLNDTDLYVALPYKWQGERPKVRVTYHNLSYEASIMDVGPWMIDDPYWETGARPLAETCHDSDTELPRGPNEGQVPSNAAGIDLSPALFKALGMQTNDLVDWEFVSDTEQVA